MNKTEMRSKIYSLYDFLPEDYIDIIRVLCNGSLPAANYLSAERALREADSVIRQIDYYRKKISE